MLKIQFKQSDLINNTGRQNPQGICLGLVTQWLIAISKGITGDKKRFWEDINKSLGSDPSTPLLGAGYARQAIEFQNEYVYNISPNPSTGEFARQKLKENNLTLDSAFFEYKSAFENASLQRIMDKVLNDKTRYFIFGIGGKSGRHAIGIYRKMASQSIFIFDPNIGEYSSEGRNMENDLLDIGQRYMNGGADLHQDYLLEAYK